MSSDRNLLKFLNFLLPYCSICRLHLNALSFPLFYIKSMHASVLKHPCVLIGKIVTNILRLHNSRNVLHYLRLGIIFRIWATVKCTAEWSCRENVVSFDVISFQLFRLSVKMIGERTLWPYWNMLFFSLQRWLRFRNWLRHWQGYSCESSFSSLSTFAFLNLSL
jgi:hypothetical protein